MERKFVNKTNCSWRPFIPPILRISGMSDSEYAGVLRDLRNSKITDVEITNAISVAGLTKELGGETSMRSTLPQDSSVKAEAAPEDAVPAPAAVEVVTVATEAQEEDGTGGLVAASPEGEGLQALDAKAAAATDIGELPPGAEESDRGVLPFLPEDAPPGHLCYTKVQFNMRHKQPLCSFTYGSGADKVAFQCTLGKCVSRYGTEHVARACYMRFEAGASKDEVLLFRADCYERLKAYVPEASRTVFFSSEGHFEGPSGGVGGGGRDGWRHEPEGLEGSTKARGHGRSRRRAAEG